MKKQLLFAAGLLVSAPLAFAQVPAAPPTPASPATPDVNTPPPDVQSEGSGSLKKGKNSAGGAGKTDGQSGSVAGSATHKGDFAAFDADGDGQLSKDEVKGDSNIDFTSADKNHDGMLSKSEYQAAAGAKGSKTSKGSKGSKGDNPTPKP